MKQLRVYLDTSVLGGYFDEEFSRDTAGLIDHIRRKQVIPVISDVLFAEIANAPEHVRNLLDDLSAVDAEFIEDSQEVRNLQQTYLTRGILSARWHDDAMHVALATIARVDAIASWNFKHIVDPRRIRLFNEENARQGYGALAILSPSDIVRNLEQEE